MGKRKTTWVGGGQLLTPEPDVSTSTAEVVEMIKSQATGADVGARTSFVIDAIYLHFSVRRVGILETEALGFLVWTGNIGEASNAPVQALDALSTDARLYGNKNIMMMAPLPVPPILASSDLATAIQGEGILVAHHEFQASRKLDISNQGLFMTVNSETALAVGVFAQWRVLLAWT